MALSRRAFVKTTAAAGALSAAPYVWTNRPSFGQEANKQLRLAAIGVGGSRGRYNQGGADARKAARFAQMVAVCDVDDRHTEEFNNDRLFEGKLKKYRDYREMLDKEKPDVVTIGTPDHWHVTIAIAALKAGCDVYCEKPLTLTIDEGIAISKAVKESGKVFQVGTQQRSEDQLRFLKAIAIVQSGRLGKNVRAYVAVENGVQGGPFDTATAPDDFDWNMWLGPATKQEYSERRRKEFRWYYDYSGGKLTDWGAHHIDIAQWALGFQDSGPVKISGECKFTPIVPDNFNWHAYLNGETSLPNGFHTPVTYSINCEYANGAVINVSNRFRRESDNTDFGNGILFEGDEGKIFVNRGRLSGLPIDNLTEADNKEIDDRITKLYKGKRPTTNTAHMNNFFECIKDRGEPVSDVYTHHRTMTTCHLCNIALMLGRELRWDPTKEQFVNDSEAEKFRTRKRREGFELS